ncbi:YitT family protein [Dysgonomonas sp. Marseille-P4677]|uniref:YitT family protein n=1 Tax=Dysgonomonas sp. Marseille-P4677 TaxID=2364790 RepID=UPI0019123FE2|nr:YitT family protein [Dysgonomonas sp. Marseille-P4677]MBK5719429.1 YitT family protein [Dysgonomonas sp. Marseille-P4677]
MPKKYLKEFYWKDYLNITIGLSLYAIGLIGFIRPGGIVTGGLAGVGLLIEYATSGKIVLQETYFAINCVLLIVALKILGLKFLVKTIYGVVVLTGLLTLVSYLVQKPIIADEPLLSGVIGGMMCGAGIGLVFSANGSTGGTDIVVAIINKYKNIAFGRGMLLCDFIIISCSYFVFQDFNKIVYGLIVMGVMTYSIDMIINGFRQSVQVLIISDKYETIANAINKELHRGCTLLDGMGWYTQKPTKVIMVLAKRTEALEMFRLIKSIDEKAFISQSTVRGVYGEGFDKIKT